MSDSLLGATERPIRLVNRLLQLETIKRAIFAPIHSCEIIMIIGGGGIGKSRLVEWALACAGNPQLRTQFKDLPAELVKVSDWRALGNALVSDVIDMSDTRLGTRARFLRAIRDALTGEGGADFSRYDDAYWKLQRHRAQEANYFQTKEIERAATEAFLEDYREVASERRIVLALDTVERLAITGSEWLMERGLISLEDLAFNTQLWLRDQIRAGGLPNTTLLLAGRGGRDEGDPFLDLIRDAAEQAQEQCNIIPLELNPFGISETQDFFKALAEDWERRSAEKPELPLLANTAAAMRELAKNSDQTTVLAMYTGGQPVLLSLYADLIVEGQTIPERLLDSPAEAKRRLGNGDGDAQKKVQTEIQGEFINLLFGQPGLRAEILKMLVRAPRGLDAEQLCNLLDATWTIDDIANVLHSMRDLSIIKRRAKGTPEPLDAAKQSRHAVNVRSARDTDKHPDERFGLQDEVYRIYAEWMADDGEKQKYETAARHDLYQKLEKWAEDQLAPLRQRRREFLEEDERKLNFGSPTQALAVLFPETSPIEEAERIQVFVSILDRELERIHYALLSNLERGFNDAYFDVAETFWRASDEDADLTAQVELHRVLFTERHALKFINLSSRTSLEKRGEEPIDALKRAAQQDAASRWIKRYILRGKYPEAIQFYDDLENAIRQLEPQERRSWQHTFSYEERVIWREYARLFMGKDTQLVVKRITEAVGKLKKLAECDTTQRVSVSPDREEYGFIGHPAEIRLKRLIAFGYNAIGYGSIVMGNAGGAVENYTTSLRLMRETDFIERQSTTVNNLSRALSDMGLARSRRVCLDALNLRKDFGAEIPVAYSWNTLSLIDNDWFRPDLSWKESATAVAYFRRADQPRGLGLALLQLGEALRRLGNQERREHIHTDSKEGLYRESEKALQESLSLFTVGPARGEKVREVEAKIEMGCLQRDLIGLEIARSKSQAQRRYREALSRLTNAAELAKENDFRQLYLDAQVNVAWTHYAAQEFEKAESMLDELEQDTAILPLTLRIRENTVPPEPERNIPYVYYQQAKMYGLRGRIAMDRFRKCADELESIASAEDLAERRQLQQRVCDDSIVKTQLQRAADAYVIGVSYAQLYSPRSSALATLHDAVYDYLKKFNPVELERFAQYVHQARIKYQVAGIKIVDLGDMDDFIRKCFGDYLAE